MRISDCSSDVCSSDLIQDDGAFDRRAVGHEAFESPAMTFISVGSTGVGEADHAVTAAGTGLGGLLYALISEEAGAKHSVDSHVARQIVEVRGVYQTGTGLGQGQERKAGGWDKRV